MPVLEDEEMLFWNDVLDVISRLIAAPWTLAFFNSRARRVPKRVFPLPVCTLNKLHFVLF